MAAITESDIEGILSACAENAAAITESLNQCFDLQLRIGAGDSLPWSPDDIPLIFSGPGLAVVISIGSQSLVCLIPESLPLPVWYSLPNDSQQSRLQTLAMEWSMNLLPAALEAEAFRTVSVLNLKDGLEKGEPAEWAAVLQFPVYPAQSEGGAPASSHLLLVVPLEKPTFTASESPPASQRGAPRPNVENPSRPESSAVAASAAVEPAPPSLANSQSRRRRLYGLPVRVSVRLAEKKIEMGQLLNIAPGALITFSKSCEDLLDLYVNNHKFGRGEAVKIGENFGLKINEVGVEDVRPSRVLS